MKFWDTSALAPLLWDEQDSTTRSKELKNDPILVVWWATAVEIESALFRRLAKGEIDELNESHARARLPHWPNLGSKFSRQSRFVRWLGV